jgi:alpha-glucosidase
VWSDEPLNNWKAAFPKGESVWQWDDVRGQYYLRCFAKEQPDLNWDNPDVVAAMLDTLRFWLDRGIDGFRMDVVHLIGKDLSKDDPPDLVAKDWSHVTFNDVDVTHERLRAIRGVLDSYAGDRTSVGEVYLLDIAAMSRYYGDGDELHMSFNFAFLWAQPTARSLAERIETTLREFDPIGAWPTWVLSNHDVVRHRQRHGGDERVARIMAVMLLTLRGTPFVYQGEELGLLDAVVPPERIVDLDGRDGCRAPIPWDSTPLHGWQVDPWLPFPPEADERNVAVLRDDETSILHLYRDLLALRRSEDALLTGALHLVDLGANVLAYHRDGWLIVLNFGSQPVQLAQPADVAVSSDRSLDGSSIETIPPVTAIVARPQV